MIGIGEGSEETGNNRGRQGEMVAKGGGRGDSLTLPCIYF